MYFKSEKLSAKYLIALWSKELLSKAILVKFLMIGNPSNCYNSQLTKSIDVKWSNLENNAAISGVNVLKLTSEISKFSITY